MLIQTELNENYGFFPYSTFVKLENFGSVGAGDDDLSYLDSYYNLIIKENCNDIIFYGSIINNIMLEYLSSKLMCEGYYVSYYSNKILYSNLASRIILSLAPSDIYPNIKFLNKLSPKDIIIVNSLTIKDIKQVRNIIINNKLNFTLFYNGDKINQEDIKYNLFYDEYPYFPSKLKINLDN